MSGHDGPYGRLASAIRSGEPVCLATVVAGPHVGGKVLLGADGVLAATLAEGDLRRVVERDAAGELVAGRTGVRHYGHQGQAGEDAVTVFIETFAPPPRMLVFGAIDFTAALVRVAKVLGYHVTVCDAREVFATTQRFPLADRVVVDWPDRLLAELGPSLGPRDAVCVLTHDPRFDVPALTSALATGAGYVGAMGSRRTHEQRLQRLREEGVGDEDLCRVMSPIGLDLGARTPEETAVSICAEIIALRTGRPAASLRDATGPIH